MPNLKKIHQAIRDCYGDEIMNIADRIDCPKEKAKWLLTVVRGGRVKFPAK